MVFRGVPDRIRSDNGPGCARVAWAGGSQNAPHRAWVAVAERLHRECQREVEGRSAGHSGLLYVAGGAVQVDLQPGQAAQHANISADKRQPQRQPDKSENAYNAWICILSAGAVAAHDSGLDGHLQNHVSPLFMR